MKLRIKWEATDLYAADFEVADDFDIGLLGEDEFHIFLAEKETAENFVGTRERDYTFISVIEEEEA